MRLVPISILFVLSTGVLGAQVAWINPNPSTAPSARKYTVMVWDSVRERVVLFGGQEDLATYHSDTWEWDGTRWTEMNPATRPPAREDHMMAFDASRGRVVMFGGHDVNVAFFNDTWEWDGVDWRRMPTTTTPFPRAYGAMAYDPIRQLVVMYGGVDSQVREIGETWEWNGVDWRARFPQHDPGRRTQLAMCWDPVRQRIVLYGGQANMVGWYSDQWEWNGIDWINVTTTPAGPALADLRMVFDTARSRLVLWGGQNQPGDKAWERVAGAWVERSLPAPVPGHRQAHTMAYDQARQEIVMFGGWDGSNVRYGDTWLYRLLAPADSSAFGNNCGGPATTPPTLTLIGNQRPWLGDTLTLRARGRPALHAAVLAVGLSRQSWSGQHLPFDLGPMGMTGCELLTSADVWITMPAATEGAELALLIPVWPQLVGRDLFVQAFVPDSVSNAAGLSATGGLALRLGAR